MTDMQFALSAFALANFIFMAPFLARMAWDSLTKRRND